jgi:hypothetical protein
MRCGRAQGALLQGLGMRRRIEDCRPPLFVGAHPVRDSPRGGVSLRRFVAHRVRSHRQASMPTRPAKADAQRGPALSPQRFGRVAQRMAVPAVWPPMEGLQQPSSGARAYPSTMLRALSGHSLWVTFLLGQQEKSDSSGGSRSKRPPRRRHAGLKARPGDTDPESNPASVTRYHPRRISDSHPETHSKPQRETRANPAAARPASHNLNRGTQLAQTVPRPPPQE